MEQIYRNARVVMRDEDFIGSVVVRDGLIAAVDRGAGTVGEDFDGDVLMPGVVDIHTDNLERHYYPRQNIGWNPVSASVTHDSSDISVGVTTVFNSMSVGSYAASEARETDKLVRLVDGLLQAKEAGMLKASHFVHWRCETTSDELRERLPPLAEHPLTAMFSMMDHTPGQRQHKNVEKHVELWRARGLNDQQVVERLAEIRERQARNAVANARFVSEVAKAKGAVLMSHDDETDEHVDLAADLGATVAEFPVTQAAAERARARGMTIVMGGPNLIRGGSYSGNVPASALVEAGLLDGFASDYVPRSLIECVFALAKAPFGWSLPRAVATVTAATAEAGGLTDRGA
ncbi:MAG TPA: alpha-D-ribose 1-methylphosphonate 5-triphosphate diphosphatase, partial [Phenylobacterium sp.]